MPLVQQDGPGKYTGPYTEADFLALDIYVAAEVAAIRSAGCDSSAVAYHPSVVGGQGDIDPNYPGARGGAYYHWEITVDPVKFPGYKRLETVARYLDYAGGDPVRAAQGAINDAYSSTMSALAVPLGGNNYGVPAGTVLPTVIPSVLNPTPSGTSNTTVNQGTSGVNDTGTPGGGTLSGTASTDPLVASMLTAMGSDTRTMLNGYEWAYYFARCSMNDGSVLGPTELGLTQSQQITLLEFVQKYHTWKDSLSTGGTGTGGTGTGGTGTGGTGTGGTGTGGTGTGGTGTGGTGTAISTAAQFAWLWVLLAHIFAGK